jgi:hypothetical protein
MLNTKFLTDFKRATEKKWSERSINPILYGFQFQQGTCWNPGMRDEQIAEYEAVLKIIFPYDFKSFLRVMNGTDIPTLNVYGHSGEPSRQSVGVFSYPRDLEIVRRLIRGVLEDRTELAVTMAEQGFVLPTETKLIPIYGHRYLLCTSDLDSSVVLSVESGIDAIVFGDSLKIYLEKEFLRELF